MNETNGAGVALVCGAASTLGLAVAVEMANQGNRVALHDGTAGSAPRLVEIRDAVRATGGEARVLPGGDDPAGMMAEVRAHFGRLDYLINLYLPDPEVDETASVVSYPGRLWERCKAAGAAMASSASGGAIVNHACLPSLYAGTKLQNAIPVLRSGLIGVTRSTCVEFAPVGVRASWIQTGFLEVPEARAFASARVLETRVPIGRWSTAEEFAKLAAFLAIRATYLTGQGIILDGGLTAGNSGT